MAHYQTETGAEGEVVSLSVRDPKLTESNPALSTPHAVRRLPRYRLHVLIIKWIRLQGCYWSFLCHVKFGHLHNSIFSDVFARKNDWQYRRSQLALKVISDLLLTSIRFLRAKTPPSKDDKTTQCQKTQTCSLIQRLRVFLSFILLFMELRAVTEIIVMSEDINVSDICQ